MTATRPLSALQIGFIVSDGKTPITGSQRYYFDLMRSLPASGVSVHGLVVGDPNAVDDPVAAVQSFAPEGASAFARLAGLRRSVQRLVKQADLVASHHASHTLPILDVVRSRPIVAHFHGPLVLEGRAEGVSRKNLFMRWLAESLVYARTTRFIVLSRANGAALEREYRIASERIRVVPGGVDLRRFRVALTRAQARRRLGWPPDRPIVVAVRRLAATKGLENLLTAIREVRRLLPDLLLVLVGTGPLRADLERQVQALRLERWVRFAGQITEDLALAYRAADFTIVPSVGLEGFGLVVIESLACGTPAFVTPVTGLPEVVSDLDPGLILEGTAPADIAQGVHAAVTGAMRLPDEETCRRYAERFDWPVIAGRVRDVYREVA